MKYIKLFEGFNNLEDFCNSYLAYLLDEGFEFTINKGKTVYGNECYMLFINKQVNWDYGLDMGHQLLSSEFNWDDVKDYIIPFLEVLCENYNVYKYIAIHKSDEQYGFPYDVKTFKNPSGYSIPSTPINKITVTINK